jgi:thiamine pyrophosphate-dependent acetolactate synthase large subunit-like protein
VLNGDGCILMNLGSLTTIASEQPENLAVVVIDNGTYEVTGGQPLGGAGIVDYCGLARSSGFLRVFEFADPCQWSEEARPVLYSSGPVFVRLGIAPRFGQTTPKPRRSMAEQIDRFRAAVGVRPSI